MDGLTDRDDGRFLRRRRRVPPRRVLHAGHGIMLLWESAGEVTVRDPGSKYWDKPHPLGYAHSLDAVGTVAAPLLAGFSLASAVLIADDQTIFRWPGRAIIALTVAAIFMIATVQAGFRARQFLWSFKDAEDWWPEMKEDRHIEEQLRNQQHRDLDKWRFWVRVVRRTYHAGILALLSGLALALPPPSGDGEQETLRWAAAVVAVAGVVGEVIWIVRLSRPGRKERAGKDLGKEWS